MEIKEHTPVFICSHIYLATKPVLLVDTEDSDWQMLCGGEHTSQEKPYVVGLIHLLERDPSLNEILDLPINWEAERASIDSPWVRKKLR